MAKLKAIPMKKVLNKKYFSHWKGFNSKREAQSKAEEKKCKSKGSIQNYRIFKYQTNFGVQYHVYIRYKTSRRRKRS